jgi:hypothetical protein
MIIFCSFWEPHQTTGNVVFWPVISLAGPPAIVVQRETKGKSPPVTGRITI